MKKCSKCEVEKKEDEFNKNSNSKDCLSTYCKECNKLYMFEYYELNKNKIIEKIKNNQRKKKFEISSYNKKYKADNKEKQKEYQKEYREKNKDMIKEKRERNYEENKESILEYQRKYRKVNPENRDKINKRFNSRYKMDSLFRLRNNISKLIRQSIKNGGYTKNSKTHDILGCSFVELIKHLNSNKYGFKYEDNLYDIDHIIPTSSATTEEEMIKLNHYTNLQLLPKDFNRKIKRDKDWDENLIFYFENSFLSLDI
jgi:hypothetical protein